MTSVISRDSGNQSRSERFRQHKSNPTRAAQMALMEADVTGSDRSKQSGEELISLLKTSVFSIRHQVARAGGAAVRNTD